MESEAALFDGTELDFWVGDWDVTWPGGSGTNRLTWILDGHVLHERFEGGDAESRLTGESWSVFDAERSLWRQTWVDNSGSYLDLVGQRVEAGFAFARSAPERGDSARQRMVFRDITGDRFRWTWELSLDGGATWTTLWEIGYRRR